jgi:hypothetical protein
MMKDKNNNFKKCSLYGSKSVGILCIQYLVTYIKQYCHCQVFGMFVKHDLLF